MIIISDPKQESSTGDQLEVPNAITVAGAAASTQSPATQIRETADAFSSHPAPGPPQLPPAYSPYPHRRGHSPLTGTTAAPLYRRSPFCRFVKAFSIALVLYLLIVATARSTVRMAFRSHQYSAPTVGVPSSEDGTVLHHIDSTNWAHYESNPTWPTPPRPQCNYPYGAQTTFTLPVDADSLYLIARGAYQHGRVRVRQSDNIESGSVRVDVRAAYYDQRALARVTLCRFTRADNEHGIGIYTPQRGWTYNYKDQVQFLVAFTFPMAPVPGTPLHIKRFDADTSQFSFSAGDLWETMLFDDVVLRTSNSHINITSIVLKHGSFRSSNGYIAGHYNASGSLKLATSNGKIKATVCLLNEHAQATELDMQTSNSLIQSEITLSTPSNTGGAFEVSARTSNSPISLRYADSPLESFLASSAVTSNSDACVKMHSTFEGSFELTTSNSSSSLKVRRGDVDPAGRGRQRVVAQHRAGNVTSGTVSWGPEVRYPLGSTSVRSTNGRVSLEV
ncbi:hypothetical protein EDD16DRAFT_196987 [Pisolithus croceorrhizus]|nr:hypothetical protein EDD16DRAFT_196987 [Pisolithus croceorrhizus]KAI6160546.1 hypothetical protein EDD17DRAFT_1599539 [Pisolithus thermaeus]